MCEKTTFISHPYIKKYLVLVGPGDLTAPPVVVNSELSPGAASGTS